MRDSYKEKKIAIIGASYFQAPLINKAKNLEIETHVFAWECGDVGEKEADFFYPISIVEKEKILEKCKELKVDGICSIASDLAMTTVNYVANNMGLVSNSLSCTEKSTNKHIMRRTFEENGNPSPKSICVSEYENAMEHKFTYPIIVKPTDRSGSRGVTKLECSDGLESAIQNAIAQSFEKMALIEEFASGDEYSVECISFKGKHSLLQITKKYTSGAPHFIETGHLEPALLREELQAKIKDIVFKALDSLEITYGASHSEIKIAEDETIAIIEIGARMGGDFIGSHLVELSTGVDFVKAVLDISLGLEPNLEPCHEGNYSLVRFVFDDDDLIKIRNCCNEKPQNVVSYDLDEIIKEEVTDSSSRHGYAIFTAEKYSDIQDILDRMS